MAANIQQLSPTLPITALCFLPSTHISESILLAGEGCVCKIYSPATSQLLHTRKIFQRESISGIAFLDGVDVVEVETILGRRMGVQEVEESEQDSENDGVDGGKRRIVFWGGHRILVTTLEELISDSPSSSFVEEGCGSASLGGGSGATTTTTTNNDMGWTQPPFQEVPVKDWVHHAFFIPRPGGSLVAVLTSHNQLLLYETLARKWVAEVEMGEMCTIYSASGVFVPPPPQDEGSGWGRIVVAAGTAFGDILVWSAPVWVKEPVTATVTLPQQPQQQQGRRRSAVDAESWTEVSEEPEGWEELTRSTGLDSDCPGTPKQKRPERGVEVHYRLKGHEGSIFGVDISPSFTLTAADGTQVQKRYLASCSDDRTVRIWDVSRVDGDDEDDDDHDLDGQSFSTIWDKVGVDEFNTGFTQSSNNNNADSEDKGNKDCVAIGWGHTARIWNSKVLSTLAKDGTVNVITTSEDLSSKLWKFEPLKSSLTELRVVESTHLHSGKNIFAMAVDEHWGMLATGGHDSRIAVVSYGGVGIDRADWELSQVLNHELEAVERSLGGLQITGYDAKSPKSKKFIPDAFRNYAVLDKNRFLVSTNRGWLATYTFPSAGRISRASVDTPGQWRNLGKWDNLEGISVIAAWEGAGLIAAQDKTGLVGVIDLYTPDDLPGTAMSERRGRWWKAGDSNPGPMFCGRYGDLYYLLTTSLVDAEIRLHLFPDPRVSNPTVRNASTPPPGNKTVILCPPPGFQSVTAFHLDFMSGLLFLGGRTGMLAVFDVWTGRDVDIMLNPLDVWKGFHDKDAVTCIIAYPTPAAASQKQRHDRFPQTMGLEEEMDGCRTRVSRIVTGGRNGVYAILKVTQENTSSTSCVKLSKLHVKKPLNGGIIEGLYFRGKDLITYGFRGKSFFVWNETRNYEVFSEDCGGCHRSWAFYKAGENGEESGVGWFVRTQAGRLCTVKTNRPVRRVLQPGNHGREIKALAISPPTYDSLPRLIATGAEDTVIRLSVFRPQRTEKGRLEHGISGATVFKKHTTGIQHLAWSDCGEWLFSSGGVEEFFVWRVSRLNAANGGRNVGVVCEAVCPEQSVVPDLRIMGFDVTTVGVTMTGEECQAFLITMVYSDSSIKVWLYDPFRASFRIVISGRYKTSCLLHVKHHIHRRTLPFGPGEGCGVLGAPQHAGAMLLFVAGTDGFLSVYDVTPQLRKAGIAILTGSDSGSEGAGPPYPALVSRPDLLSSPPSPTQILPPPREGWTHQVHQSSIKSIAILPIDVGSRPSGDGDLRSQRFSVLVITGGDDCALAATTFTLSRAGPPEPDMPSLPRHHSRHHSNNLNSTIDECAAQELLNYAEYMEYTEYKSQFNNLDRVLSVPTFMTKLVPEAHASGITAVVPLWAAKPRWTGDGDDVPIKEVVVKVFSAGLDRVVGVWDVSVLVSSGGGAAGSAAEGSVVGVRVEEVVGARAYTPVADVAAAEIVGRGSGSGSGSGRGHQQQHGRREECSVAVVGVGIDLWDVKG
ncbi:hypothetical protein DFH27DRAFT_606255 [Peziza echinospora]|nr:hypothetical protein DFH27DRAFT_606255 [Peziza echinospora]